MHAKLWFLLVGALLLSACGEDTPPAVATPPTLAGTWGGTCLPAGNNFQQAHIAFTSQRMAVRNVLFGDVQCTSQTRIGNRVTTGTYDLRGAVTAGTPTPIDFVFGTPEDVGHENVLPRAFDVFVIENGRLSFGDYGTGDGSTPSARPTSAGNQAIVRIGDDTSDIFQE
jgi:hypothetical protein